MEETKTETIVDVMADLRSLAPHRFYRSATMEWVSIDETPRPVWPAYSSLPDSALIQAACQQECEARDWAIVLFYDPDTKQWDASIWEYQGEDLEDNECALAYFDAPKPADAVSTALRDALKHLRKSN